MAQAPAIPPDPRADAAALRAFVAIARLGSVGRAAEALGRTQPSVSARLSSLEAAWGTRLFRREARGMALTPEGARLFPLAESALRALEAVDVEAGAAVAAPGEVRIGAGDALGREVLPRVLSRLIERDPRVGVRLVEGPGPKLLEALRDGAIDVALLVLPDNSGGGFDVAPLLESPVDVLFPPGSAPGRRRVVAPDALRDRRLVALQEASGFRRHVAAALAARGVPFVPSIEVGNLSLVRRFVAAGAGVAPVPAVAFDASRPGPTVERRRLDGVPPVVYRRVVRAGAPLSEPAARFLEMLEREVTGPGRSPDAPPRGGRRRRARRRTP